MYVHFPWCLQRCPYCDFATEAIAPQRIPHADYADAVVSELSQRCDGYGEPLAPSTLFFGGGTPSLWDVASLAKVVRAVTDRGAVREVTVECNPTSIDTDRAMALRDVGVTRLSLGVQSLRDKHLRYLGRLHDARGALDAVRAATAPSVGLRVSADLMFGMHEQRDDELAEDVATLVSAGVEHMSCYALTIEPSTRFGELARKGRLPRLTDDSVASLYDVIENKLEASDFVHYEVSNYALPGAESAHNVAYWRGAAYLGLGAGAVGCLPAGGCGALRWRNDADAGALIEAVGRGETPPGETEALDAETRVREALMLGLRTSEGVDLEGVRARTGLDAGVGREAALARQVALGNVVDEGARWRIPRGRWLMADGIVASMF